MKHLYLYFSFAIISILLITGCKDKTVYIEENDFQTAEFADFLEKDFPFLVTALDNGGLGKRFPSHNPVPRALTLLLGNESYVGFDTDMLRWSVAWQGDFATMTTVAQVSYHNFFSKEDSFPVIKGEAKFATGVYPGWTNYRPDFHDPRNNNNEYDSRNWGPIPSSLGRWNGTYAFGDLVILHYEVAGTEIHELPSSFTFEQEVGFVRTLRTAPSTDTLYTVLAEFNDVQTIKLIDNIAYVTHADSGDTTSIIALQKNDALAELYVHENRYLVMALAPHNTTHEHRLLFWSQAKPDHENSMRLVNSIETEFPDFQKGGSAHWSEKVYTKGKVAPDTSAYVLDELTLPMPNPWKRNVRVSDLAFFQDGKAAVSTFDGDIWILKNINKKLNKLEWNRYASGIFEPMSILVKDEMIYVFGRDGITKLHDLNGDGEADYYQNFSSDILQSMETREWAADMVSGEDGYFYIAKGGGTILNHSSPETSIQSGYNAATAQAGSISKISPDGKTLERYATGLRMPYIGLHPQNGTLSVSDQQGNFVPATPIYLAEQGDYFGVVPAEHHNLRGGVSVPEKRPLTWIPHYIDRSSTSQLWVTSDKMGPLNQSMVHFSFGRTGLFSVLMDTHSKEKQAGVTFIPAPYPAPVLKGAIHPKDGFIYIAGFNLWGSNSSGISALTRMRYTGKESVLPIGFQAGEQGIILQFSEKIDKQGAENPSNFKLKRWNYERTSQYGSGHFLPNGEPGEETLPVLESHLSQDGKSILMVIPDMEEVMQMQLEYKLKSEKGRPMDDIFTFTVNSVSPIELSSSGFGKLEIKPEQLKFTAEHRAAIEAKDLEVSKEKGEVLFKQLACIGCHATDDRTEGMYGTPFGGLFQSKREFKDGSSAVADKAYIKESIVEPRKRIVKGYGDEMPPFGGILSESDVESLTLYIMSL